MSTGRITILLVSITVLLQSAILYRQRGTALIRRAPQIRQTVAVKDAPKGAIIDLVGLPSKGAVNSKIVLVEFSDFECPFCIRHASGVAKEIDKEFISTGLIKLVFVNNPLPVHPHARDLAVAAICADAQNQYWPMHDALFAEKPREKAQLQLLSGRLGLNPQKFQKCLEGSPNGSTKIDADMQKAKDLKMGGTPSFAVGIIDVNGTLVLKSIVMGAQPLSVFEKAINDAILLDHGPK